MDSRTLGSRTHVSWRQQGCGWALRLLGHGSPPSLPGFMGHMLGPSVAVLKSWWVGPGGHHPGRGWTLSPGVTGAAAAEQSWCLPALSVPVFAPAPSGAIAQDPHQSWH